MVSHNFGTSLFTLSHSNGEVKVSHCSFVRNVQVETSGFFALKDVTLALDQSNFMQNQFTRFAQGGRVRILTKIVTDFSLGSALVDNAVLLNPENAFKVLWVDAGMKNMETWVCWALGESSPSPSQSPPPFGEGTIAESGIFIFLVLSIGIGIPAAFGYVSWRKRQREDLSVLDDLPISNR
jgi:hypothetical protein